MPQQDIFRQWIHKGSAMTAALALNIVLTGSAFAAELPPQDIYAVHGLFSIGNNVTDMNDLGITSGRALIHGSGDDFPHAVKWDETGVMTDLDPNFLNDSSTALGINNQGDTVGMYFGFADRLSGPVLFSQGNIIPLLDQNGAENADAKAQDINDNGLIVGCANNIPVVWNNSVIAEPVAGTPDSVTGCAKTTNDQGDIVGYATINGSDHAVLWRNGQMTDLGMLPGHESSIAYGINAFGQIVGSSSDTDGSHENERHPFLWDNGVMIDLGTLSGNKGTAFDINDKGHIVGNAPGPFLYRDGVMFDLTSVAQFLSTAVAINEAGQIAGSSYVLTPATDQLDMSTSMVAPAGPIDSGTEFNFEITVTNISAVDGQDVRLENSLSNSLTIISAETQQGICNTTVPVICELGTVAAQSSVNIILTVKADVTSSSSGNLVYVSNYARVTSSNPDVNGANNSAYQSTTITPPPQPQGADVSVSLSASPSHLPRRSKLTYTATVTNNGPTIAVNTEYTHSIYARFRLRSIKSTHGDCSGKGTIRCDLGDLAPNEIATITITVSPRVSSGSRFFSTSNVSSDSYDPAVSNNSTSIMTTVQ